MFDGMREVMEKIVNSDPLKSAAASRSYTNKNSIMKTRTSMSEQY